MVIFLTSPCQPAYLWLSLLGLLSATEKLVPLGRLYMRPIQISLRSQWSQAQDSMFALATMSPEALHSLHWWTSQANLLQGSPFHLHSPSVHFFMDASSEGWGAHLDFQDISGQWAGPSA